MRKHPRASNLPTPQLMKHTAFIISAAACALLASSCQEQFDKRLKREAEDYTMKHCPQQAEEGTVLDSLTYDMKERVYTMWYTLNKTNAVVFRENEPILHDQLIQRVQTDETTKSIRNHDVTFRFVYRSDSAHTVVYETRVTPQEYAQK